MAGTSYKQVIGEVVTSANTTALNGIVGTTLTEAQLEQILGIALTNAGFTSATSKVRSLQNQIQATIDSVETVQLMIIRMGGTQKEYDLAQDAIDNLTALQNFSFTDGDAIATSS